MLFVFVHQLLLLFIFIQFFFRSWNLSFHSRFQNGAATITVTSSTTPVTAKSSKERGSWGNDIEFLMSCIAMSVGLGNVWRFPFTALENGGGICATKSIASIYRRFIIHLSFFCFMFGYQRRLSDTIHNCFTDYWTTLVLYGNVAGPILK